MRQNYEWKKKYKKDLQISINKSPVQFKVDVDIDNWIDFMQSLGLSGKEIGVDIPENLLMESGNNVKNKLIKYGEEAFRPNYEVLATYSSAAKCI